MNRLILLFALLFTTTIFAQSPDCEDEIERFSCECEDTDCDLTVSVTKLYAHSACSPKAQVCLNLHGNVGTEVSIHITFDADLYELCDTLTFSDTVSGPDQDNILTLNSDTFSVFEDLSKKIDLSGSITGSPEIEWEVINVYYPTEVIESGTITFPAFKTIDGTSGNGTTVSAEISNGNLLNALQARQTEQYIILDGILTVDQNYSFTSSDNGWSQIYMIDGAEIIVEDDKRLSLIETQIYGCEKMWKSITLEPGSELRVIGSRIEDGAYAIDVEENFTSDLTLLEMRISTFLDNYISLRGLSTSSSKVSRQRISSDGIRGCTFRLDNGLIASYTGMPEQTGVVPYAGIIIENWPMLNFSAGLVPGVFGVAENYFGDLENGILMENSDVGIFGARFTGIEAEPFGFGIRSSGGSLNFDNGFFNYSGIFKDCDRGVSAQNTDLRIHEAEFDNVDFAIRSDLTKGGMTEITDCEIDFNLVGVRISGASPIERNISGNNFTSTGPITNGKEVALHVSNTRIQGLLPLLNIFENDFDLHNTPTSCDFENCTKIRFYDNKIDITTGTSDIRTNLGIDVSACEFPTIFSCNEVDVFDDSDRDVAVHSLNSRDVYYSCFQNSTARNGIQIKGPCVECNILTSDVDGSDFDLIYGADSDGITAIVGQQRWKGNMFTQTTGSADEAIHYNINNFLNDINRYIVEDEGGGLGSTFWPNSEPQTWFREQTGTNLVCNTQSQYCDDIPGNGRSLYENRTPEPIDTIIIEGRFQDDLPIWDHEDSLAYVWTLRRHLYRGLYDADADSLDDYYRIFIDDFYSTTVAEFEEIEKDLHSAFDLYQDREDTLDLLVAERKELIESLISDHDNYLDTLSNYDSLDLSFLKPTFDDIVVRTEGIDSLMSKFATEWKSELDCAKAKNNAISTSEDYESNEKVYNSVLIRFLQSSVDTFSSVEVDSLESIANQCYASGGDAVLKAQALLGFFEDKYYANDSLCMSPAQIRVPAGFFDVAEINCYPNPTSDDLTLEIPVEYINKSAEITIFSSSGAQVEHFKTVLQRRTDLNTSQLKAGIYFARIKDANEVIGQFKFVKE